MGSYLKLFSFLKPYRKYAILAPIFMLVEVSMELLQPAILQSIIDVGIANGDLNYVVTRSLLMVVLSLIGFVGGVGAAIMAARAAMSMGADVRAAMYKKVQSLSFGNLDRIDTGNLITRLTSDVTTIQTTTTLALRMFVRAILLLIGSVVMVAWQVPQFLKVVLMLIPILVIAIAVVMRLAYPLYLGMQKRLDSVNSAMQENLTGIRVVKAFVRGDYENQRFGDRNEELRFNATKAYRTVALIMPVMMLVINLGIVSVLWIGGNGVVDGSIEIGQILATIQYLMMLLMGLMMAGMVFIMTSRAGASSTRALELLGEEVEIKDKENAIKLDQVKGEVKFENVTFSYDKESEEPVLKNINFTAKPGEIVAVIGATGSGKSTVAQLIPRLYDTTEGRVLIDGVDVKDMDKQSLRSHIGMVMQQALLFSGSLSENIKYGNNMATQEELEEAAKNAQASEFIRKFESGFQYELSQRATNLSGGQKQRTSIARALVRKPSILIFDDSTSALDAKSEEKVQHAIRHELDNTTVFLIAQKISSVRNADKILVLDDGHLDGVGTHEELLKESPVYREIYNSQMGEEAEVHG